MSRDPDLIIRDFKNYLLQKLGSSINGIYIIGSYALNDFNNHLSDIDFIVSIKENFSYEKRLIIDTIHRKIEAAGSQPNLNGIYIKEHLLGKTSLEIDQLTYFHEGVLKTDFNKENYYEITPITWAELKHHRAKVYEAEALEIAIHLEWKKVDQYMFENINTYWKKWLNKSRDVRHPYYYQTLFRVSENAWCVAGVSRQLYSLLEEKITSKRQACEYFLDKVPAAYTAILQDTIHYRKGLKTRSSWVQKRETLAYLEYTIAKFNQIFEEKYGLGN
ncbi:MAG: nucleotidyltransferase domain-containing protein [Bacteroidota bacterium]